MTAMVLQAFRRAAYGAAFMCLVVGLVCVWGRVAGSGYHPGLDEAMAKASVVVEGTVMESWYPVARGKSVKPIPGLISYSFSVETSGTARTIPRDSSEEESLPPYLRFGEVYRIRVEKVYKGPVRPGEELEMWDPFANWTGGYWVDRSGANLAFLVPPEFWGVWYRDDVDYRARVEVIDTPSWGAPYRDELDLGTTTPLYAMIQNYRQESGNRDQEFDVWSRLLDYMAIAYPKDTKAAYRAILETERNHYLIDYVIEHWPGKLDAADVALFRRVIESHGDSKYVRFIAEKKLLDSGYATSDGKQAGDAMETPGLRR